MMAEDRQVKIPQLRSVDDFFLGARYAVPNVRDTRKINNRVISNLLYYQTNYFGFILGMFIFMGFFRPTQVLIGMASVLFASFLYGVIASRQDIVRQVQRNHPIASLCIVLSLAYLASSYLGYAFAFFVSLAVPITLCLLHALLRTRSIKNQWNNVKEKSGIAYTPMGILLERSGMDFASFVRDLGNE